MAIASGRAQGGDHPLGLDSQDENAKEQHSRRFPLIDRDWLVSPSRSSQFASNTYESIVEEFTACWERGETPHVEPFLERMKSEHPADVIELIYHEFCLAETNGLKPDPNDYFRRFPDREESLGRMFELHGALNPTQLRKWIDGDLLPDVGDEIGPFVLVRELGRGTFARVYLAEQGDLDNRPVVVKISTRLTSEPRLLARARHPHIVEVLWHGSAEDGTLHLITLPFLGGATLANVLARSQEVGHLPRSGIELLANLDHVSAPEYPKPIFSRPAREIMGLLSYQAAVAWLMARLAEALNHAYDRGVAHGDIKPSNILLTADGIPMLLDFNLAVGWGVPDASNLPVEQGGTLGYMAPERLRAIASTERAIAPSAKERHRADIFALGIVLLECLSGQKPGVPQDQAKNQQELAENLVSSSWGRDEALKWLARSSVSRGLRSILERCLAPDPADRYGCASELAEDLDRWRTGRPLAHATKPPWPFQLAGWIRRHRLLLLNVVLGVALCCGTMVGLSYSFRTTLRQEALEKLELVWDRETFGVFGFLRFGHWVPDDQSNPVTRAREFLDHYNVLDDPNWSLRNDIRYLPEPARSDLTVWLLEQILRYTRGLANRPNATDDWRRALALLDQTVERYPLLPLESQRRSLRVKLAIDPRQPAVAQSDPQGWMELYLKGVELEGDHAREALTAYEAALKIRPSAFWPHYRAATVAFRLGEHANAAEHLRQCIAQRPGNVALKGQLSGCLFLLQRYDDAFEAGHKALELDPDHEVTTRNMAYVQQELGQSDSVQSKLYRYLLLTRNEVEVETLKLRLESLMAQREGPASPDSTQSISLGEDDASRILRATTYRKQNRPEDALTELNLILNQDPDHLEARFYRGMLLRKLPRSGAEQDFAYLVNHSRLEELIAHYPDAISIYHQHVSDLLRRGRAKDAIRVARLGLNQSLRCSGRMLGESHYTLARSYAMAAKTDPTFLPKIVAELNWLAANEPNFLKTRFEQDRCFDRVREQVRPKLVIRR